MVYVDPIRPCRPNANWRWRESCHLFADTVDELHSFASAIGLKRAWFQAHRRLPHYDLTRNKRAQAVKAGAVELTLKEMAGKMRALRRTSGSTGKLHCELRADTSLALAKFDRVMRCAKQLRRENDAAMRESRPHGKGVVGRAPARREGGRCGAGRGVSGTRRGVSGGTRPNRARGSADSGDA